MQKNSEIGWVGTGVMGSPMCRHLIAASYPLHVFNRTAEKARPVIEAGAHWCESAMKISAVAESIFTMVGTPQEVEELYFGEDGLFSTDVSGKTFIDMGTTPPRLTTKIAVQAELQGAKSVDAPVSGGDVGARDASLSIMAGGDEATVLTMQSLFDCLGTVRYMGRTGSGQHTKMCNQITVAGTMIGVCEALVYAQAAGLDTKQLIQAIRPGAAGCWTLDNLAPRIVKDDFAPGFMVDHFVKDLGIALQQAESMNLDLPGLALADRLYRELQTLGHGQSGTQALIFAIAKSGADKKWQGSRR